MSALPLAVGYPQPAAWLGWWDCLLLVGVAATSFWGQLSLTRGFQLLDAGKAAGLNFSQVRHPHGMRWCMHVIGTVPTRENDLLVNIIR